MVEEFKHTEVGVIPNDWDDVPISQIFSFKQGVQCPVEKQFSSEAKGLLRFIRIIDLTNSNEPIRYIQDPGKSHHVEKDDLFMVRYGSPGLLGYGYSGVIANNLFRLLPKKKISNNFYFHYLTFIQDKILGISGSSTMPAINFSTLSSLPVVFPPTKAEQTTIANSLNDADALILKLEQLITKKRNIKTGALQELLKPKEGWEEKTLGEIALFYKGKGLSKSQINTDGKTKCIHYGELFIKYNEQITEVTGKTDAFEGAFYSKSNDVLMPTSDVTPTGLATASCLSEDNVILGGDVLVIRIPNSIVNGSFLSYYIKLNRNEIMKLVKGVTVFHLHASDMKDFILHFPKIEEQNRIAQILFEMETEIHLMEKQLDKYKMMKQGMMQSLLTGKIRLV